jgi:hypothetical protein
MQRPSREERRKHLKERTQSNWENRDKGSGKGVLDLSKLGDKRPAFFSPKNNEFYTIDIIPFLPKSTRVPGFQPGYDEYALDFWKHSGIGPGEEAFVCLAKTFNKPCPICEELAMLKKSGAPKEETGSLEPKRRFMYNLIDLESKDQKIMLWEISYHLFEKALIAAAQVGKHEVVSFSDLEEGKTIKFTAKQKSLGAYNFIEATGIGFMDRQPYDEKILDEAYALDDILIVPTYEQVRNALHGITEEDAPKEEQPARRERPTAAPAAPAKQEATPAPAVRRERPAKQEAPAKGKCPYGHAFGTDCDQKDDCPDCDIWEACCDGQERMQKGG